ncbi:DUF397 domain-containing protein [Streptomyces sp. MUM 203J]|uniref:DUF397 domain-containing protein n=1 Tax=Streptomyces sp. MUM 203J TaxID=2791990 RepID=UPI001F0439FF|nr:DUF397 domain-containing protein [Streptomyces sp. MUM 203J]MCH0541128.1 DUF397 domain-containing protein [Streptomyces sp. MUM 203J]
MMRKAPVERGSSLEWFKSSYSRSGNEADCVEVATTPAAIHIRDSKTAPDGPRLAVTPQAWGGFLGYAAQQG